MKKILFIFTLFSLKAYAGIQTDAFKLVAGTHGSPNACYKVINDEPGKPGSGSLVTITEDATANALGINEKFNNDSDIGIAVYHDKNSISFDAKTYNRKGDGNDYMVTYAVEFEGKFLGTSLTKENSTEKIENICGQEYVSTGDKRISNFVLKFFPKVNSVVECFDQKTMAFVNLDVVVSDKAVSLGNYKASYLSADYEQISIITRVESAEIDYMFSAGDVSVIMALSNDGTYANIIYNDKIGNTISCTPN